MRCPTNIEKTSPERQRRVYDPDVGAPGLLRNPALAQWLVYPSNKLGSQPTRSAEARSFSSARF
jgi:hypothetical protein